MFLFLICSFRNNTFIRLISPPPPGYEPPTPVYKPTQNPLRTDISPLLIMWVAVLVGKTNYILRSDWLFERARCQELSCLHGIARCVSARKFFSEASSPRCSLVISGKVCFETRDFSQFLSIDEVGKQTAEPSKKPKMLTSFMNTIKFFGVFLAK